MLDIKWAMEQFGIKDKNIAISVLGKLDKFNNGCLNCRSSYELRYTEIGEVLCKECRDNFGFDDDGLLNEEKSDEAFALIFAEDDEDEWLDEDDDIE